MNTQSTKMSLINYRPDIDGLRAIAVLSVILFHINSRWLPGGFVGVDIFFVISGYLITSLLRKEISQNTFTFKNFYIRRIRRIAPALLTVLLATTIAAFMILKPLDMRSFVTSLGVQVISFQNIMFLAEGEYFIGSNLKPLLHTWSLAVEEQFYLIWPMVLLCMKNWKYRNVIWFISTLIIASFLLNLLVIELSPKTSFFTLPTRAWELAIGGLGAILSERQYLNKIPEKIWYFIAWIGLVIISLSFIFINSTMPFPGKVAIYPALGTVALIIASPDLKSPLGKLLSNRGIVYIGLMSYAIYLWHWPILVYAHYLKINIDGVTSAIIILTTLLLSYFSYRYVETPIRKRKFFQTSGRLLSIVFSLFILLTAISVHTWVHDGASYRYSEKSQPFLTAGFNSRSDRCGFIFRVLNPRVEICELVKVKQPRKSILLWGNSHADMWSGMLIKLAENKNSNLYLNSKNCRATADSKFCNMAVQRKIIDLIAKMEITDVILASTWYGSYDVDDILFENMLTDLIAELQHVKTKVWLVVDVPQSNVLDPLISYALNPIQPQYSFTPYLEYTTMQKNREVALFNKIVAKFDHVKVIDTSPAFCDHLQCTNGSNGKIWYRDTNHITNDGAFVAQNFFLPIFEK